MAKLDDLNPAARRGFALALGSLAPRVLGAEEMDQEEPEQELVIDEENNNGDTTNGNSYKLATPSRYKCNCCHMLTACQDAHALPKTNAFTSIVAVKAPISLLGRTYN